jgi:hypothetical protein
MKDNLENFENQFKHCLCLEDKYRVPENWKRSKFKELVTSEYGEQMASYNRIKWYKMYNNKPDGGNFQIKYLHFQNGKLFHGSRLIILRAKMNTGILLSWGAQVDYGV